jgi:hypothetical protein
MRSNPAFSACGAVFGPELSRGALVFAESLLAIAAPGLTQKHRVEKITLLGHLDWIEISQSGETHAEGSLINSGDASERRMGTVAMQMLDL